MAINRHLLHVKSNQTNTVEVDGNDVVSAKLPRPADIEHGEIAINYHKDYETISIKNDNNEIVQFPNLGAVNTLISEAMSGAQDALTFDETPTANSTNPVTSGGIKSYVDAGDSIQSLTTYQSSTPLAVGDTHDQALSKLSKIIDDNEIITARALTDLNDTKQDEIDDLDEIRTGAALGATALQTETQLSKGTTTGNGNVVTDISVNNHQITLTKGATALTEHQSIKTVNGNTMVGTGNVSVGTITGITMNNTSMGTSGVVDLGNVVTSETQLSKGTTTGDGNAVTDITVSDHQITLTKGSTFLVENDLANYADGAEYDSEEHLIYLKHGNTRLANPINAADFIKDGMVNSVRIDILDEEETSDSSDSSDSSDYEERYLIITFNTDAGLEDIEIPLSDIFDPSLYYTKEEIDEHELVTAAALTELHDTKLSRDDAYTKSQTYNKQEVDEIIEENELTIAAALNDLNSNKQDKLEFDDEPTEDSSNIVTSDGIKTYVDTVAEDIALVTSAALNELNDTIEDIEVAIQNIQPELDFDDTPTAGSDNPVTSSGIKTYVDNAIGSLGNIVELNEPGVSTPLAVGDTYDEAFAKLTKIIRDNEFTTAGALTELYETKQDLLTFDTVVTEDSENPITSGAVYEAMEDIDVDHLFETTYSELKTLRDGGQLVPGAKYRITDYNCTTSQENTQSAGHQFDIILLALSKDKLAEEGWAMMHDNVYDITTSDNKHLKCYIYQEEGSNNYNVVTYSRINFGMTINSSDIEINNDTMTAVTTLDEFAINESMAGNSLSETYFDYNYFQNSNLSAWKVWYCLDNDTARFAWADESVDEDTVESITVQSTLNGSSKTLLYFRATSDNIVYNDSTYYCWEISQQDSDEYGSIFTSEEVPESGDTIYLWNERNRQMDSLSTYYSIISYIPAHQGTRLPNGRGVIYRLIDELGNDCPYDFKNIQFIRPLTNGAYDAQGTNTWCYTLNYWNEDDALSEDITVNNIIQLNGSMIYTFTNNNVIEGGCYDYSRERDRIVLTLGNNVILTHIDHSGADDVYEYCSNNTIKNGCYNNTFGSAFISNTIDNCGDILMGDFCAGNELINVSYAIFGNSCNNNILHSCYTFNCGNNCGNNVFEQRCHSMNLSDWVTNCHFGANVGFISFLKNYVRYIDIKSGNQNIDITSTQTTSINSQLQNFEIDFGVNSGTNPYATPNKITISHNSIGDLFRTTYQAANSQVVSV